MGKKSNLKIGTAVPIFVNQLLLELIFGINKLMILQKDKQTGILYMVWETPDPEAIFLLIHGLGGHSARWQFLSQFFLKSNISSYAIELKGFGETEHLKGHISSFKVYHNDICRLHDIIHEKNADKKIFLIGESLGGLISFLTATDKPHLFDGLICISPAFKSKLKVSFADYIKILFFLICNPKRQLNMPFTSGMCTRDINYQKIMDMDKREHRLASARLLFETLVAQVKSGILKDKIKIPLLFLIPGEDKMVDSRVSKGIFNGISAKDKTLIEYPGMYHALSIDLDRGKVFADILNWAQKRI